MIKWIYNYREYVALYQTTNIKWLMKPHYTDRHLKLGKQISKPVMETSLLELTGSIYLFDKCIL